MIHCDHGGSHERSFHADKEAFQPDQAVFSKIARKVGRVRTCKVGPCQLEEEAAWIERYRQLWAARFEELDKVIEELKRVS